MKIAKQTMKVKANRLEKEIKELKEDNKSKSIFKIVRAVNGPKKQKPMACAVIDPATNKLATSKKEILATALSYCESVLSDNEPCPGYEKGVQLKKLLHEVRQVKISREDDYELTEDRFDEAIKRLAKKNKK